MSEIWHHGILGMKWGVRRFQNKDGSLTAEGRKRYLNEDGSLTKKGEKELDGNAKVRLKYEQTFDRIQKQYEQNKLDIKDIIRSAMSDVSMASEQEYEHSADCYYWLTSLFDGKNGKNIYDIPEIANHLLAFGPEENYERNRTKRNYIETGKAIAKELGFDIKNMTDDDFDNLYALANDRS